MNDLLSGKQRLILFRLLFTGETPAQSEVKPAMNPKEREQLIRLGLIRLEPKPKSRAKLLVLTDRAWEWASENLDSELSPSPHATPALQGVLRRLKEFLGSHSLRLADLFDSPDTEDSKAAEAPLNLPGRIREAYLALSGGQYRHPVRLSEMRMALQDVPQLNLDAALLDMQQKGDLSLQTVEDPRQLLHADHEGAIHILGTERHLVYLEKQNGPKQERV